MSTSTHTQERTGMINPKRFRHLACAASLATLTAACTPTSAGPATPPSTASLSSGAGGQVGASTAGTQSGAMQGMDHSRMQGMDHSNMSGMNHAGMDHNAMMAHCAEMRQTTRAGRTLPADMRQMIAQCNEMDRSMAGQGATPAARAR